MGLDFVELLMDVEDEFDVRVDEESHLAIQTVGDLHVVVLNLMTAAGRTVTDEVTQSSWISIQRIVSETYGVDHGELQHDTRFVEDLGAG